jgi:hypothetical protein
LIVARLDRFARSNVGAHAAADEIERAGGVLISVAEQIDGSTHTGNFVRSIFFALAQMELERISENWKTSKASAVGRGVHIAPNVPPGYLRGADDRLVPHLDHADAVRLIFRQAGAGASLQELADVLNEANVGTVTTNGEERPTTWHGYRIRRLLSNRVYLGEARSGEHVNPAAHEPLVTEQEWHAAQLETTDRPRPGEAALLSGMMRCASCRYAMRTQGGPATPVYRCATTSASGRCPRPVAISKAKIEQYVVAAFLDRYHETIEVDELDEMADGLAAGYEAAERAYQETLTSPHLRRELGQADYERMVVAFRQDRDAKRDELQAARDSAPQRLHPLPDDVTLDQLVDLLQERGDTEQLRGLLASGISAVFVRPAESRARNIPTSDRVRIIFHGDESISLPRRGARFTPTPYVW